MKDPVTVVGTITAKNYLARVRVLAESLAAHHPELPLFVMLTDEIEGRFVEADEAFNLMSFTELTDRDASLRPLAFAYDRKTLAVACKPLLLGNLLDRGYSRVVFVDADTLLLGRIDTVLQKLDDCSILLCPHRLQPPTGSRRADIDLGLLRSGTFNAGLVGVRDTPPARRFIDWWRDRLERHCRNSPEDGFHFDQRWLDLVPGLFPEVGLETDPEINVGWWNFDERPISIANDADNGAFGGCRLFHASGYEPDRPEDVSIHAPWLSVEQIGPHAELFARYRRLLEIAGQNQVSQWPYAFGKFDNGVPISPVVRDIYLDLRDSASRFGDPFVTPPATSFFNWLRESATGAGEGYPPISNLWFEIYLRRPDVRQEYPEIGGEDRHRFVRWTLSSGVREHCIPEAFRNPTPKIEGDER